MTADAGARLGAVGGRSASSEQSDSLAGSERGGARCRPLSADSREMDRTARSFGCPVLYHGLKEGPGRIVFVDRFDEPLVRPEPRPSLNRNKLIITS